MVSTCGVWCDEKVGVTCSRPLEYLRADLLEFKSICALTYPVVPIALDMSRSIFDL